MDINLLQSADTKNLGEAEPNDYVQLVHLDGNLSYYQINKMDKTKFPIDIEISSMIQRSHKKIVRIYPSGLREVINENYMEIIFIKKELMVSYRTILTGNKNIDVNFLIQLDDDALLHIFKIDQYSNSLFDNELLWYHKIHRKFMNIGSYINPNVSFRENYLNLYRYPLDQNGINFAAAENNLHFLTWTYYINPLLYPDHKGVILAFKNGSIETIDWLITIPDYILPTKFVVRNSENTVLGTELGSNVIEFELIDIIAWGDQPKSFRWLLDHKYIEEIDLDVLNILFDWGAINILTIIDTEYGGINNLLNKYSSRTVPEPQNLNILRTLDIGFQPMGFVSCRTLDFVDRKEGPMATNHHSYFHEPEGGVAIGPSLQSTSLSFLEAQHESRCKKEGGDEGHGPLQSLKRTVGQRRINPLSWLNKKFQSFISKNNLTALKFIHSICPSVQPKRGVLSELIITGNIDMIGYIMTFPNQKPSGESIRFIIVKGDLVIIAMLATVYIDLILTCQNMDVAIEHNRVDIVQFLWQLNPLMSPSTRIIQKAINKKCFDTLRWIYFNVNVADDIKISILEFFLDTNISLI